MIPARRDDIWSGPQLAGWLAAAAEHAPAPSLFAISRETHLGRDGIRSSFAFPGSAPDADAAAFQDWLLREQATGAAQSSVALLLISEVPGPDGMLAECVMERRLGALDGPYMGHPARVEFVGAARSVRMYGVAADLSGDPDQPLRPGRNLVELHVADGAHTPRGSLAPEEAFAGEEACLRRHFGPGAIVLARRTPTLLEQAVGLSVIVHVRDGPRIMGCGIGWHGPVPYLLVADFPRFDQELEMPPEAEAAIAAALRAHDLLRHEIRIGQGGTCVMARRRGSTALVLLRWDRTEVRLEAYDPSPLPAGNADQQRWVHYAEQHEHRQMLDVWLERPEGCLIALAADPAGEVWRHEIDQDGVELSRTPANDTAVAILRREFPDVPDRRPAAESPGAPDADRPDAEALVRQASGLAHALARMPHRDAFFGPVVADRFPAALFHIREAHRCLLFRRPTASVFHLAHVLRIGLDALPGPADASAPAGRTWTGLLSTLQAQEDMPVATLDALRQVRAHWGTDDLAPLGKYTEEEAELMMERVGRFMTLLAEGCDQPGASVR